LITLLKLIKNQQRISPATLLDFIDFLIIFSVLQ